MRRRAWLVAATIPWLLLLGAGCQAGSSPEAVGRAFYDAVCTGEFERAYELMDPGERLAVVGSVDEFVRDGQQELAFLGRERFCATRDAVDFRALSADYGVLVIELEWLLAEMGPPGSTDEIYLDLIRVDGDWYVDPHAAAF